MFIIRNRKKSVIIKFEDQWTKLETKHPECGHQDPKDKHHAFPHKQMYFKSFNKCARIQIGTKVSYLIREQREGEDI